MDESIYGGKLQLVEEGKIDLSARVCAISTGSVGAATVTIRQLLTDVSGMPNILRAVSPVTFGLENGANEERTRTKTKALWSLTGVTFSVTTKPTTRFSAKSSTTSPPSTNGKSKIQRFSPRAQPQQLGLSHARPRKSPKDIQAERCAYPLITASPKPTLRMTSDFAIKNYKRSLELGRQNTNALQQLKKACSQLELTR